MICDRFIHIGIGDTGEGIMRFILHNFFALTGKIEFLDKRAHLNLRQSREIAPDALSFSFIRNPYDWYISSWIHELKLQRWQGSFADWFWNKQQWRGPDTIGHVCMAERWDYFTSPGVDAVGRFEHFEEDTVAIFAKLMPELPEEEVRSWFPAAYGAWSGRPWIECIEQWMRNELYTPDMRQAIEIQDREIFQVWGYTFEEHYNFIKEDTDG